MPEEFKEKLSLVYLLQGVPIAMSVFALLFVFVIFRVNILLGGFVTVLVFLLFRLFYEIFLTRGQIHFVGNFCKGLYDGVIKGASILVYIGVLLGSLNLVVRMLILTGLGEKISYFMVSYFGKQLSVLLFSTIVICIIFGMAVSTVAAYVMVVTLAAPALLKVGVDPLVTHFCVFYWAMLSCITPPVAGVCVITASIAKANFLKTCWESMKLGSPKFIMPFVFVTYPAILG